MPNLNLNGCYNDLRALLEHMAVMRLSAEERLQGVYCADDLARTGEMLERG